MLSPRQVFHIFLGAAYWNVLLIGIMVIAALKGVAWTFQLDMLMAQAIGSAVILFGAARLVYRRHLKPVRR